MSRARSLIAALLTLGFAAPAHATIHTVDCVAGPFFTIGSAISAAGPGDTIVVHPCTYNENLTISGADRLSVVGAGAPGLVGSVAAGVGVVNNSSAIVNGGGLFGPCIRITGSTRVTITGLRIENCATYGILTDTSDDTAYHANRIQTALFSGINDASNRPRITSNTVALNGGAGIVLENATEAMVADNLVGLNGGDGIFVFGDDNQVVNNKVQSNSANGIVVSGGLENRLERNSSSSNSGTELVIDAGSIDADVVGNSTAGSLTDVGVGTELADNV